MTRTTIRAIADRRFGVGCDQVLVVEPARGDADFRYRIFNADGGEVEQCGNGARCFVMFVREHGLTDKREIRVETAGGIIVPRLGDDGLVTVDMGVPRFRPGGRAVRRRRGDARGDARCRRRAGSRVGAVDGQPARSAAGGRRRRARRWQRQGPAIEHHARFPNRVNAGYMQVVDRVTIRLRVWERGAGETLACGTGACAAVVAGIRLGLLDTPVRVITRGGELRIAWGGDGAPVMMTGPASTVYEGEWPR